MAIESPTSSTPLTSEQNASIEMARQRLSSIESSITIATGDLTVLKKEILKHTKENEYLKELFAGIDVNIQKGTETLDVLNDQIIAMQASRGELIADVDSKKKELEAATVEIEKRLADVVAREYKVAENEVSFIAKNELQTAEKARIDRMRAVADAFIVEFVWK